MALIVPYSTLTHEESPEFACTLCEAVFTRDERHQFERHVLNHPIEDVQARSPKHMAPGIFDDDDPRYNDVEWTQWIRKNAAAGNDPMVYMRTDDGKHSSGIGDG
jgi:hypothetical protein